jgi:hypothetical protein
MHFLGSYKFPVMMYVAFPNGTIAHQVNANEYMDETSILKIMIGKNEMSR